MSYTKPFARLGILIAGLPLCVAAMTQDPQPASPESQQYRLIVVRGQDAHNNIKKGRATMAVVEVRDRNDKPMPGIAIIFTLPDSGASGTFVNGGRFITAVTDSAGQASASVQPNAVAGSFNISVSANAPGKTLTASIGQTNVAGAAMSAATIGIIAGVAVAGAVGAAVALGGGSKTSTPSNPPTTVGLSISAGSIPSGAITPHP